MWKRSLARLFNLAISALFGCAFELWATARRRLGGEKAGTCIVLYYHEVRSENRLRFARQMDMLLRYTQPVHADHVIPLSANKRYAAVTFDDGYLNVIENAIPELEKRRIPATLFIITDALGKLPNWLTDPNSDTAKQPVVSAGRLRELSPDLVTVGSHTRTHARLTDLQDADAKREIFESRRQLEEILGVAVRLFSFPFGAFNAKLIAFCKEGGYERVFTTKPSVAFRDPREFVTGRVSVEPTDWPLEFRLKLRGAYRWQVAARSLKSKVRGAGMWPSARIVNFHVSS
jgi:peptidoglycan/xylan/chitin deacetylase (PgdA/CDA1 family)